MILVDWQIKKYVKDNEIGISPFSEQQVNPNSYDLTLSYMFQISRKTGEVLDPYSEKSISSSFYCIKDPEMIIPPGGFILGSTVEKITLPNDIVGSVEGKSSLARLGLSIHQTGGYVDAGFSGNITLELYNCSPNSIRLYENMPICQIVFTATSASEKPYMGKYQGQTTPTLSRFYLNCKED